MKTVTTILAALTPSLLLLTQTAAHAQLRYTLIATSGNVAPGTPVGVRFAPPDFLDCYLDPAGNVIFPASLAGPGVGASNDYALFAGQPGQLRLIARNGSLTPLGSSSPKFEYLGSPQINTSGRAVFRAWLSGNGVDESNDLSYWTGLPGPSQLIVREGSHPWEQPVLDAVATLNAAGQVLLQANFGSKEEILTGPLGSPQLLAATGMQAPGTSATYTVLGNLVTSFPSIVRHAELAENGQVAFSAVRLSDGGWGIWVGRPGSVNLLARNAMPAPGTEPFTTFTGFSQLALGDSDRVAFYSALQKNDGSKSTSLWVGRPGDLQLVARQGAPFSPAGPGMLLGSFETGLEGDYPIPRFRGNHLAFMAYVRPDETASPSSYALFAGPPDSPHLLLREGDPAPGLPEGVSIAHISQIEVNPLGETAFQASLRGPGLDPATDRAVWMEDAAGRLLLAIRQGDIIDFGAGDLRTLRGIGHWRLADTGRQLILSARFTDDSWAVLTVTVPEPVAMPILAIGVLSTLRRRRRP